MAEATTSTKKTEYVKVKMQDGREVDFPTKRKLISSILLENSDVYVQIDYVNGETRKYQVPPQHLLYAAGHGYKQKLQDWVAGLKDESGNPADPDDVVLEIDQLHDRLVGSEDWNTVSEGGGAGGGSIIIKAVMEHTGKTLDQVKAWLNDKLAAAEAAGQKLTRQALYASLRGSAKLKPIIDRLEAEKNAKRKDVFDADAHLSELA